MTLKHWITLSLAIALAHPGGASALCPKSGIQIPKGSLSQALISLGQQCEISLLVRTSSAANYRVSRQTLQSPDGQFESALKELLKEVPLSYKRVGASSVAVIEPPATNRLSQELPENAQTEEVTVTGQSLTGSHLRHFQSDGYLPVDRLSRDQLEMTGAQTIADLLKFLPAISGNSTSTSVSQESDGTATVSLRGLPANSTLVLINGRRIISDGFKGEATDLNTIPLALVERVEILKDGASAVYGSDAIAGVVNIILQRDFEGLSVKSFFGQTPHSDRESESHNLTWGWRGDRAHVMLNLSQNKQGAVMSRNRNLSSSADSRALGGSDQRSSAIPEGFIALGENDVITSLSAGLYQDWSTEDKFDYSDYSSAVTPTQNDSIYIAGNLDIGDSSVAFSEIMGVRSTGKSTSAPTPVFTHFDNGDLTISADNLYNTFDQDIYDVRRRIIELGPRVQNNQTNSWRFNTGLKGFWDEWQWELGASIHRAYKKETLSNVIDPYALSTGLKGPDTCNATISCIPINLLGPSGSIDPNQLDYIRGKSVTTSNSRMTSLTFITDGIVKKIPAGNILAAAGIEFRRESVSLRSNDNTGLSFIGGHAPGSTEGTRTIKEAFAEVSVPIISEKLWFDGAIRTSYYNDFGDTSNPKLAIRWKPAPSLLVRSSYTAGFRAPTLTDMNQQGYQTQEFLFDPCTSSNASSLPGCLAQADNSRIQYLTEFSGNPDLKPETSRTASLGVTWQPPDIAGFTATLDFYDIDEDQVIGTNPQFLLDQNAYFNLYTDLVVRDGNGDITQIYASRINQGSREIRGYDTAFRYEFQTGDNSQLQLALNISRMLHYLNQSSPESNQKDFVGTFTDISSGGVGSLPKWKANAGAYWNRGPWNAGYTIHYVGSLTEAFTNQDGTDGARKISDWSSQDIQISYTPSEPLKFAIGINNLLDTPPPFASTSVSDNYDYQTYDLTGRFLYGSISLRF
ncbi:TonB-dependent receptor [Microbulbifer sp. OS29]|uniref:TonB-dependent receptor n=1 Tax=Microbulbifer okhotskensis TaxID=2926617 RepID=A0A9X2J3J9_9GAMM|nr:TonB-dependent receptor [Microbulbifer okhotskensis]MCO1333627.1 TonB-dependent receptor [Microbulbifer okhotskensis]